MMKLFFFSTACLIVIPTVHSFTNGWYSKFSSSVWIVKINLFAETFKFAYISLTGCRVWLVWAQGFCTVHVRRLWIQINILFMFEQPSFSSMKSPFALLCAVATENSHWWSVLTSHARSKSIFCFDSTY